MSATKRATQTRATANNVECGGQNVVAAMLKNRECWTRFLSLHGESTCLALPGGGGNGFSKILLCRSIAQLGGAHSIFRCVSHSSEETRLATRNWLRAIYKFFPTPLKRRRPYTGATQKEITERTAESLIGGDRQPQPIGKKARN